MQNNPTRNKHRASSILVVAGVLMMFLGFIFPGWLWLLNTRGDVEMLPLAAVTLVGVAGVAVLIAGVVKRVLEKRR